MAPLIFLCSILNLIPEISMPLTLFLPCAPAVSCDGASLQTAAMERKLIATSTARTETPLANILHKSIAADFI